MWYSHSFAWLEARGDPVRPSTYRPIEKQSVKAYNVVECSRAQHAQLHLKSTPIRPWTIAVLLPVARHHLRRDVSVPVPPLVHLAVLADGHLFELDILDVFAVAHSQ